MFDQLETITHRPAPFEFYTAAELWTDPHTSKKMLAYHLDGEIDVSSRRGAFIDRSASWIGSHFNIGSQTRVADFGCGPGLYTTRFARLGAQVTGVDFSSNSLGHARRVAASEQLRINYVNQDYLTFTTGDRYDLITMIMCDYCALGPTQRQQLLSKFHTLLNTGGAVLLDVYSLNAFDRRRESISFEPNLLDGFWSPAKYYGFLCTLKYPKEKVVLDKYTIVEAERTRVVYNWLQHFDLQTLEAEFTTAGFEIESSLGDVAGATFDPASNEFAVIGRKP